MSSFGGSIESALQEALSLSQFSTRGYQDYLEGFTQGSFALRESVRSILNEPRARNIIALTWHHDSVAGWNWSGNLDEYSQRVVYSAGSSLSGQSPQRQVAESISNVEAHYIITEGRELIAALFSYAREVPKLLVEALPPLKESFGDKLLQLHANADDDDISLKATILWPGDIDSARSALDGFDQRWWLESCGRAHGHLVFDYELVDGL